MEEGKELDQEKLDAIRLTLPKLKNLKYFREWSDNDIVMHVYNRKKNEVPPQEPPSIKNVDDDKLVPIDDAEYKKTFNTYLQRYKKEYSVDMNDSNDAESLRSLVRFIIQQEQIDLSIRTEQSKKNPHAGTLKSFGDFQRTLQQNINEIQTALGISRKARKEKVVDDIPQYIAFLQKKARDFWNTKTVAINCNRCKIELARYWMNFPSTDKITDDGETITVPAKVSFEIVCERCKETVIYTV